MPSAGREEWDFKVNVPLLLKIHAVSLACCIFHPDPFGTKLGLHKGSDGDALSMVEKYGQQRCVAMAKEAFLFVKTQPLEQEKLFSLRGLARLRHGERSGVSLHLWTVDASPSLGELSSASLWKPAQCDRTEAGQL